MRKISIDLVRPGMKVGRSIYNSNGQVLLQAGVILTQRYIHRLKLLGIPAVYIDDGWLPDIQVSDVISEEIRAKVTRKVRDFFSNKNECCSAISRNIVGIKDIGNTVNEIIDQLLYSSDIVVNLTDIRSLDEYTFGHSVNVCVLALITGIHLGYSKAKLFHLGMGALLHDIGKIKVPKHILNKPGKLTDEEFNEIKKHSTYGYEILHKNPNVSRLSALVAHQHHERYNGQGYPNGLKKDDIHEFAKITGMVDMYDALTADRVYRRAYSPHEAYEMISASGDQFFDLYLIKAFLHHIAAYPAGTLVKLNSGEIAVVVDNIPGYTKQPKVCILFSEDGHPLTEPKELWLAEDYRIFITKVINDESALNVLKKSLSNR